MNGITTMPLFLLASFTLHNYFEFGPCCHLYQRFPSFYFWVVVHVCIGLQFIHAFTYWWMFGVFLVFSYYDQSCSVHVMSRCLCAHMLSLFLAQYLGVEWLMHGHSCFPAGAPLDLPGLMWEIGLLWIFISTAYGHLSDFALWVCSGASWRFQFAFP